MKEAEQRKAQEAPHLLRSVASPCSLGRLPKQLHPLSIGGWMGESLHGPPLREASGKMCSVRRCLRYRGVGACAGRVSCCSRPVSRSVLHSRLPDNLAVAGAVCCSGRRPEDRASCSSWAPSRESSLSC